MDRYKLVVANMYRAKNKMSFFAMHQIQKRLPEFDIEFHILWDDVEYTDKWSDKIDTSNFNLTSYTRKQLNEYAISMGVSEDKVNIFHKKFHAIYFVIHAHYLRKNNITDYYLIYDDDILLRKELSELKECLKNKIPVLLTEPMNQNCDKSITKKLIDLYDESAIQCYLSRNPHQHGFNAGFQGMSLEMYDDFLTPEMFCFMIDLFNFNGIYDENGEEIWGPERSVIDTQQQSFFSTMNIIRSTKNPHILNTGEYFICPNWGTHPKYGDIDTGNEYNGWDINMKSKVVHFIGHSTNPSDGYIGKPKVFLDLVDKYLEEEV